MISLLSTNMHIVIMLSLNSQITANLHILDTGDLISEFKLDYRYSYSEIGI